MADGNQEKTQSLLSRQTYLFTKTLKWRGRECKPFSASLPGSTDPESLSPLSVE